MESTHVLQTTTHPATSPLWDLLPLRAVGLADFDVGGTRTVLHFQTLGMLCVGSEQPRPEHLRAFNAKLTELLEAGVILGKMVDGIVSFKLTPDEGPTHHTSRCALLAMVFPLVGTPENQPSSLEMQERLNKGLGFGGFVEEGKLPVEWPNVGEWTSPEEDVVMRVSDPRDGKVYAVTKLAQIDSTLRFALMREGRSYTGFALTVALSMMTGRVQLDLDIEKCAKQALERMHANTDTKRL